MALTQVAGALRCTSNVWAILTGSNHVPIGVSSVVTYANKLELVYAFTAANTHSFQITPDETFAGMGLTCGASVDLTMATVECFLPNEDVSGYIYWDVGTSAWLVSSPRGNLAVDSFSGGTMQVSHDTCSNANIGVYCRDSKYRVAPNGGGWSDTLFTVRDWAGNLVTTPTADMRFYFNREAKKTRKATLAELSTAGANLWFTGWFDV
jgi:hypothetical protein